MDRMGDLPDLSIEKLGLKHKEADKFIKSPRASRLIH